jgi:ABC-type nitrate/sulfonate/bicarbonate transport system ATPase subunit
MTILFEDVSLQFNSKNIFVVKNINLEIKDGEFVCLLGPSGCGKSSLLSMLAGFNSASSGRILVNDQLVKRPDLNRTLVFQEYALFPWLNVIQNVAFGLKNIIENRDERYLIASRYLKMVGLLSHARDKISELSGGMKQRVAIARALAVKPELLLMDEPFGALDEKTRFDMQSLLIEIWQDLKPSVVFVTHSIDEALLLADRIIVMDKNSQDPNVIGEIKADIKITETRPRTLSDLGQIREKITSIL